MYIDKIIVIMTADIDNMLLAQAPAIIIAPFLFHSGYIPAYQLIMIPRFFSDTQ
jgi:hypothetical protein